MALTSTCSGVDQPTVNKVATIHTYMTEQYHVYRPSMGRVSLDPCKSPQDAPPLAWVPRISLLVLHDQTNQSYTVVISPFQSVIWMTWMTRKSHATDRVFSHHQTIAWVTLASSVCFSEVWMHGRQIHPAYSLWVLEKNESVPFARSLSTSCGGIMGLWRITLPLHCIQGPVALTNGLPSKQTVRVASVLISWSYPVIAKAGETQQRRRPALTILN